MNARRPGLKLIVFILVTTFTTAVLATVVGNMRFGPTAAYSAVFSSASGIAKGEDVKIAGVPVGKVTGVELHTPDTSLVTFTVSADHALYETARAAIRYKNLIGDRYVEIDPGTPGAPLAADSTIDVEHTTPAVDLDSLVNGFRPLLRGLDPEQMNRVTTSLVGVLNGQEEDIAGLFTEIGSLGTAVAERDAAIGSFVTNLNEVLAVLAERDEQFGQVIDRMSEITADLDTDRELLVSAITETDAAASSMTELLDRARPNLKADTDLLAELAQNLTADQSTIDNALTQLPKFYQSVSRMSTYGDFLNLYLCGLSIRYPAGSGHADTPMLVSPVERCN